MEQGSTKQNISFETDGQTSNEHVLTELNEPNENSFDEGTAAAADNNKSIDSEHDTASSVSSDEMVTSNDDIGNWKQTRTSHVTTAINQNLLSETQTSDVDAIHSKNDMIANARATESEKFSRAYPAKAKTTRWAMSLSFGLPGNDHSTKSAPDASHKVDIKAETDDEIQSTKLEGHIDLNEDTSSTLSPSRKPGKLKERFAKMFSLFETVSQERRQQRLILTMSRAR